ncbi:MAG TPA: HupE/UreJ family protein [Caulobacteraceae bacterium]|nr:HupE/UreJ family protein [Caulobacteraceae bacterium]
MKTWIRLAQGIAVAVLAFSPVMAHPGHGPATFLTGLSHPFTGLDHMLAMVAVGLLAAKRGELALWLWPATFLMAMLVGYGLGVGQGGSAALQPAILASVIALGALTAARLDVPVSAGVALIAACGLAHGFAHGLEAPRSAGLGFPFGFALATLSLHVAGLGLGCGLMALHRPKLVRALGGGVVLGGLLLVIAG